MHNEIYDVIIIGGGPAGLTAAIYVSRAKLKTLLIESISLTTQVALTDHIENFPGFPDGIKGYELIERFTEQAHKFDTEIITKEVKELNEINENEQKTWKVVTDDGEYNTLSVIIASGARYKHLDIPGETKFQGRGVSYCAVCDAAFFKDKVIAVIGGGDTAIEEAIFLTKFVNKLYLIHRRDRLRATKILQERIISNPKVEFAWSSIPEEIIGDNKVNSIRIKNITTEEKRIINCDGVFIFVGLIPNTEFIKNVAKLDERGYIITDENMKLEKQGLFACGDCRKKSLRQIVNACGDGAVAAYSAQHYIENLKGIEYK